MHDFTHNSNMNRPYYQGSLRKKRSDELRIVLVGRTGGGKSATGNTILGRQAFRSELSAASWTVQCSRAEGEVGGQKVAVVDTPGLFDTNFPHEEVVKKIEACISLSAPGPHAFLVVIQLGRFTEEEKETVRIIQSTFGEEASKYSLVLFTHGDYLKTQTIASFVSKNEDLKELIQVCNGRYHVFNNRVKDQAQSHQLLEKIVTMTMENGGGYYTLKMFKRAKQATKKDKKRISKELKAAERQRRNTLEEEVQRELYGGSVKHNKCVLQ